MKHCYEVGSAGHTRIIEAEYYSKSQAAMATFYRTPDVLVDGARAPDYPIAEFIKYDFIIDLGPVA